MQALTKPQTTKYGCCHLSEGHKESRLSSSFASPLTNLSVETTKGVKCQASKYLRFLLLGWIVAILIAILVTILVVVAILAIVIMIVTTDGTNNIAVTEEGLLLGNIITAVPVAGLLLVGSFIVIVAMDGTNNITVTEEELLLGNIITAVPVAGLLLAGSFIIVVIAMDGINTNNIAVLIVTAGKANNNNINRPNNVTDGTNNITVLFVVTRRPNINININRAKNGIVIVIDRWHQQYRHDGRRIANWQHRHGGGTFHHHCGRKSQQQDQQSQQ
jgi:hypothetical protein